MENADERWEEQEIQKILKKIRMGSREELEKAQPLQIVASADELLNFFD